MYGLVNKAVEQLIRTDYGAECWEKIKSRAEIDDAVFVSMKSYPDAVTYRLVGAACSVLETSPENVLRSFGRYWTLYTASEGYGELLKLSGENFVDVLQNLDSMHARVGLSYAHLQPPSFQCTDITDHSLMLHYYSDREGLTHMVVGLLEGLGEMYNTTVSIELAEERSKGADHDVFHVAFASREP